MKRIGFFRRLWLAFVIPWRVLFNGTLAARIRGLDSSPALPEALATSQDVGPAEPDVQVTEAQSEPEPTAALQLLAILQREGRLLDFLAEDVAGFSDADIGSAARVVHEGCKRGLADYIELAAVRSESEGDAVALEPGFDAQRTRVTGNVVGEPPYRGTLAHHGWQVTKIRLPELVDGHDARIVAPAEVDVA